MERTAVRQCHGQLRAPRAPGRIYAGRPCCRPTPNKHRPTKVTVIYGGLCVCVRSQKHPYLRCFVASADPIFLGRRQQKTVVFTWFLVPRRGPGRKKIRRFSEPTFRPSGATNHWKNTVFRDFPTFSRICIFFLLTLSLLSASAQLCLSSVHIVGSLTSKLPSIIH